ICATHRDLKQMIVDGAFREDLLYRLNMFHVHLPPLRDRKPDIPDLARHLLARAAKRAVEMVGDLLTPEALQVMLDHDWKGNVRELANAMEYAWIVSGGSPIAIHHLPHEIRHPNPRLAAISAGPAAPATVPFPTLVPPQAAI